MSVPYANHEIPIKSRVVVKSGPLFRPPSAFSLFSVAFVSVPSLAQPAARPPPSARRASGRCELSKAAAAGRERAGDTAGGGAWTTVAAQQAVEKAV